MLEKIPAAVLGPNYNHNSHQIRQDQSVHMLSIRPTEGYGNAGGSVVPFKTPGRSRTATAHPRTLMKENATTRQALITQTGKPGRVAYPFTPKTKGSSSYGE